MRELSSVDIHFLVKELQTAVGCRIDKVYTPAENELVLQLRRAGGKMIVRVVVPGLLYEATTKNDMPERPDSWCAHLRKLIEGAKITAFEQPRSERIVKLTLEKKDSKTYLFVELYGKGNIIVTDEAGMIRAAAHELVLKSHSVKRGEPYALPDGPDAFHIDEQTFVDRIKAAEGKSIVASLSTAAGIGSFYAKELCARAGVSLDALPDDKDVARLYKSFKDMMALAPIPLVVLSNGDVCNAVPFPFKTLQQEPSQPAKSFSYALERTQHGGTVIKAETSVTKILDQQRARLNKNIEGQQIAITKLEREYAEAQRIGEHLYENFVHYKQMLEELAIARKNGKDAVETVMKKYPELKEYKQVNGDVVVEMV